MARKYKKNIHAFGKTYEVPRNSYKNATRYINRVYELNKAVIDKTNFGKTLAGAKASFREKVKQFMEEGKSAPQAVRAVFKTTTFVSAKERAEYNIKQYLKGKVKKFKDIANVPYNKKIDYGKFNYREDEDFYEYGSTGSGLQFVSFYDKQTGQYSMSLEFVEKENSNETK